MTLVATPKQLIQTVIGAVGIYLLIYFINSQISEKTKPGAKSITIFHPDDVNCFMQTFVI